MMAVVVKTILAVTGTNIDSAIAVVIVASVAEAKTEIAVTRVNTIVSSDVSILFASS